MAGPPARGCIGTRGCWEFESVRFMGDRFDGLQGNGSRLGTRGQLSEVPVEVQLAKDFLEEIGNGRVKNRSLEKHKTVEPGSLPSNSQAMVAKRI